MTDNRPEAPRSTLARELGLRGAAVPILLGASLACNLTALVVPFLEVDIFLKGRHTYSLPRSVELMWESQLYVIALLIVAFSIVFPLAKLGALTHIWFFARQAEIRRKRLDFVEPLGKWSFLDIFVVIIILVLTNDQLFVGARTVAGVYFFIAAIALSMLATLLIEHLSRAPDPGPPGPRGSLLSRPGRQRWVILPVLVLAVPALLAAVGLPFIKISQFLLTSYDYSIAMSVVALWAQHARVMSVIVAVTLVAMPALCLIALFALCLRPLDRAQRRRWGSWLAAMWQWAMIDVFGLSLLVFLMEGDALVRTQVKQGLYLIVAAIVVLTATYMLVMRANRRVDLERSSDQGSPSLDGCDNRAPGIGSDRHRD
ncbi:MAG: paraquat-inducible protein A [Planctomycetota bacterium]|jgi:paraquat-inducible protein A